MYYCSRKPEKKKQDSTFGVLFSKIAISIIVWIRREDDAPAWDGDAPSGASWESFLQAVSQMAISASMVEKMQASERDDSVRAIDAD